LRSHSYRSGVANEVSGYLTTEERGMVRSLAMRAAIAAVLATGWLGCGVASAAGGIESLEVA
jgi:hypothetical protein